MTQQSRMTSLFGDLLDQPKAQDSQAVVIKPPIAGLVDVQLSSGEVLRRVKLVGGAAVGDTVTMRYTAGEYTALASGAASSLAGGTIVLGSGGSTGSLSGAPSPHDLLGVHHTLPVLSANLFLASPTGSGGFPSFRAISPTDLPGQFSGFGNPTAQVGLTAINGSATTAMRSDAAPALNQAITPSWSGAHTWAATSTFNGQVNVNEFLQVTKTTEQFRLRYDVNNLVAFTVNASGSLTITPTGPGPSGDIIFNPQGRNLLPNSGYTINIGSLQKKYLSLFVAELWVETLVAQDTIATIGGRVLILPTTQLTRDIAPAATTIYVKHNQMQVGDVVYLEANMSVEWMIITGPATTITQGSEYSYTVTRNLDGTGANNWYAGDAVANTGSAGSGFIDLYSLESIRALTFDYIYNFTASGSVFSANLFNESSFNIMGATNTVGDMIYYGADVQFDAVYHYIQTAIVDSGATRVMEYWNGSAWTSIVGLTNSGTLATVGFISSTWTIGSQTGWVKTTVNGVNAYWVRRRLSAGTVTSPAKQGYRRVFRSKNTWGPTIAGMYRSSSTYSDIDARWAIGNLNGWYDYSGQVWGVAFGSYAGTWLGIDATSGIRMMNSATPIVTIDTSGAFLFRGPASASANIGALRWNPSTYIFEGGYYAPAAGPTYGAFTQQWSTSASTGEITAGGGRLKINSGGISIDNSGSFGAVGAYKFITIHGGYRLGMYSMDDVSAQQLRIDNLNATTGKDSYVIVSAAAASGSFANITLTTDSGGLGSQILLSTSTIISTTGRNYFKDGELSSGTGLRVGAAWGKYGIYAEDGAVAVGGIGGLYFQDGALTSGSGTAPTITIPTGLNVGNVSTNYVPSGSPIVAGGGGSNPTMTLQGSDYTSIGFHDSGNRVDYLVVGNGYFQIGYDGGYGDANTIMWGGVGIGVTNSDVQYGRLLVSGGIKSNAATYAGYTTCARDNASQDWVMYATGSKWRLFQSQDLIRFDTAGNAEKLSAGTAWTSFSDKRVKVIDGDYLKGLKDLLKIKPISYEYNGLAGTIKDGKKHAGIVAQDIQELFPEMVREDAETGYLLFDPSDLLYVLINAVKELNAQIEDLKLKLK